MPAKLSETERRNRQIVREYRTGKVTRAELAEKHGLSRGSIHWILWHEGGSQDVRKTRARKNGRGTRGRKSA